MKLKVLSVLCLASAPALFAAPVDSSISSVTVYADRALVTRTAEVTVVPGENTLLFEHLPEALNERSLQFAAEGSAAATILDVNTETLYVDDAPQARVKDLEEKLRDVKRQERSLAGRADVLKQERDFVQRMLVSATGPVPATTDLAHAPGRPSLEEWQRLYGYSEETLGKIDAESQSIDEKKEDLAAKQADLEQQLSSLHTADGRKVKNVSVRVNAAGAGTLHASLRYVLGGASWSPSYDARLDADKKSVRLDYAALVRNNTGEDWRSVHLTLSTAHPAMGGGAPQLPEWFVDVIVPRQAVSAQAYTDKIMASGMASEKGRVLEADAPAPAQQSFVRDEGGLSVASNASANVQSAATSATFVVADPVSVAANNSVQRVMVGSASMEADLRYDSTPARMQAAFLSATAYNRTDYPFLAGPVNTFLDGSFVAASQLRTVMPGEKFELHLGADEGISVKRRLVNRFTEDTGLTNAGRRVTYEYLITVTNNKRAAESVSLKEAVPVSRNEKVEVKMISPQESEIGGKDNPREVMREEGGKLVWRLELKPGEKRELTLKFAVEFPSDLSVSGLQ